MDLRRLERWMIFIRWFAALFGAVGVAIQPTYPNAATRIAAWVLVGVLAGGNLVVWGAMGRMTSDRDLGRLGLFSFIFDAAIVMGLVFVYAYEDPYVTWALLFILPMEGALRYRLKGALVAAAAVAIFFIPQSVRVAMLDKGDFDVATYVFVVGLSTLIAGVTGTMAENWHRQSLAFRQQSLRLAEVDELKDRFLAITSHEIRGPLTAIIAGVETLRKRGERLRAEQRDQLLDMVSSQGTQLTRLVDDLLVTSQIQSDTLALMPEWSSMEKVVEQAVQGAAAKRRSHVLEVFVDPFHAEIDASRAGQILRNLLENAYKYTPERTRVKVSAKQVDGGLVLEVADEGPGIPEDKRELLFDAFSRIEETSAGQEGVGLGLYLVSQLVAAMEGEIDLASSVRGTTFTLRLPAPTRSPQQPRLGLVTEEQGRGAGA